MTPTESPKLSLWTIENALVELIQAREEVEAELSAMAIAGSSELYTEERRNSLAEIDKAIAEYIRAEVGKVDNIRGFLKHAEMMEAAARNEANAQLARARSWERRAARVRVMVYEVMQESGAKRLNGEKGSFLVKGNGGVQPLIVTDEAAVPEECCKYEGWIGGELWGKIKAFLPLIAQRYGQPFVADLRLARTVDNERTRDKIKNVCLACGGIGSAHFGRMEEAEIVTCQVCGGTGTEPVPGAHLGERGSHLEVK